MTEQQIEQELIKNLTGLKYVHRQDIRDRATVEANFREKFETLNRVCLTDNEFSRLLDQIITPVVQMELKTLAISPCRAMQQIVDYKNDPGNGYGKTLLCFLQLFIVSNMSDTWYFANNNSRHFSFDADERFLPLYQFAGDDNTKITQLNCFAEHFLAKGTLAEMISRYMVLVASEQKLMVMRPYQIYAVQAIVDCIHQNCGNGYIWHTTGSGKTQSCDCLTDEWRARFSALDAFQREVALPIILKNQFSNADVAVDDPAIRDVLAYYQRQREERKG